MAQRRDKRGRRRDAAGRMDPLFDRRARYEAVLRTLGLWEAFARMSRTAQEAFCRRKFPDPVMEFDQTFPPDRPLRKRLEGVCRTATIPINGAQITVRDYFTVLTGAALLVEHTKPEVVAKFAPEARAFFREAGPVLSRHREEQHIPALRELIDGIQEQLIAHSRLETRLLAARPDHWTAANGKPIFRIVLSSSPPQVRKVSLDGAARPVYRAAVAYTAGGVRWLSWPKDVLDQAGVTDGAQRIGPAAEYPVYVQAHALRKLRQRVNLPAIAPYLESWLAASLEEPKLVEPCGGGDWLVEFQVKGFRLGYLIVTPLLSGPEPERIVVVRTFKFLTMEQTPEARQLKKHARLLRRDVEYLRLDDLAMFTQTDLRSDAELRALFQACGCGHLFDLADDKELFDLAPQPAPFAAEIRKYLRIAA